MFVGIRFNMVLSISKPLFSSGRAVDLRISKFYTLIVIFAIIMMCVKIQFSTILHAQLFLLEDTKNFWSRGSFEPLSCSNWF